MYPYFVIIITDGRGGFGGSGSSNWRDPRQRSDIERSPHYDEYRERPHYNRAYSKPKNGQEPGTCHSLSQFSYEADFDILFSYVTPYRPDLCMSY